MSISNSNFSSFLLLLFLKSKNIIKSQSSFTLAEILITIAIVAVLSTAVIITLNPAEIIKSSRDSRRLEDLQKLNKAISWFETDTGGKEFMGTSSIVYVSIPDSTSTCANLGLPTLPSGWSYNCVSSSTLQNTDGTGWIPINFNKISFGRTLSKLPIDPVNNTSTGNYYTYVTGGSWELTAKVEALKNKKNGIAEKDGGYSSLILEIGTNLLLTPSEVWSAGNTYEDLTKYESALVGYWNFDEGSGTTAYDRSGNNNNGMLYNGPTWQLEANCKKGSCISFDGVDDYISGAISNLDILPNKTFILWTKIPSSAKGAVLSFKNSQSNDAYYNLYPRKGSYGNIVLSAAWKSWVFDDTGYNLPDNQWSYLVLTVTLQKIRLYYNNLEIWSADRTTNPEAPPFEFKFGNRYYNNQFFQGTIDEVFVYNRALSFDEIKAIYEATK